MEQFALTERAAARIAEIVAADRREAALRVAVLAGGCSGFQYSLGFDTKTDPAKDELYEQHGVKVAVDRKSELYLDGTVLDFYDGLEKRGFTFNNPNAVKSCGCGSSFSA